MNIVPEIVEAPARLLAGCHARISLARNGTAAIWQFFMPRRRLLTHATCTDLFSVSVYPADYFLNFSPVREFEKWAAAEVTDSADLPDGFEVLHIPAGMYAVFPYKGRSYEGEAFFRYVFTEWLPGSGYRLADRPHYEILGARYKNDDPESEETVWIPVEKC